MYDRMPPYIRKESGGTGEHHAGKRQEMGTTHFAGDLPVPNYVLIDAALWGSDIEILFSSPGIQYRSLFKGSTGEELWDVAPYLAGISTGEGFVKAIRAKDPAGRRVTWLYSSEKIEDLRKHLRRFLRMKKEDGAYIYFRFYDPYVVNAVFPHLNKEQSAAFFEKIDYMITEDTRINERRVFRLSPDKTLQITHTLLKHVDDIK